MVKVTFIYKTGRKEVYDLSEVALVSLKETLEKGIPWFGIGNDLIQLDALESIEQGV